MSQPFKYTKAQQLVFYISWWLFSAFAQTFILHRLHLSWQISICDSLASNLILALVSFSILNLYKYHKPGTINAAYRFINWIAFSAVYCVILKWILTRIFPNETQYLDFLNQSLPIRFLFSLLVTSFITILNWLLQFMAEQNRKEKKESETEAMMREAELSKLRQQLQPHFLFNSLNSINALVGSKPEEARKMVQQLSDFLRGTLKKDDQQLVNLKEELDHLQLYLDIEKVRFGHRLNVEITVEPDCSVCLLPSLLLQPIVENAIKFGLYDTTGNTSIKINAKKETGILFIEVENPYDSQTASSNKGMGFGLSSVKRRLFLIYSRNDLLSTNKTETIFTTILKIPQANAKNNNN